MDEAGYKRGIVNLALATMPVQQGLFGDDQDVQLAKAIERTRAFTKREHLRDRAEMRRDVPFLWSIITTAIHWNASAGRWDKAHEQAIAAMPYVAPKYNLVGVAAAPGAGGGGRVVFGWDSLTGNDNATADD
jgi:hypothetical protein